LNREICKIFIGSEKIKISDPQAPHASFCPDASLDK
jgi:hypothetical protein